MMDPHQAEACRQLWCAVLAQAARDLLQPSTGSEGVGARNAAERSVELWIGGKDFRIVCALAGQDASVVAARLRGLRMDVVAGVTDLSSLTGDGRRRQAMGARE